MSGSNTRDVIIRLRGELDPTLRAAFREAGKLAVSTEKEKVASAKRAGAEQARAAREAARAEEREVKGSMKLAKDREKALQASYKAREKAAVQAARAETQAVKAAERERQAVMRASEQASGKLIASQMQLAKASKMAMSGVLSLGQGVAMLGVVGEKDMQKFLNALVLVDGSFRALRGGIDIVMALTRGYRAYQAAVAAAAVAQASLAAAQAASGGAAGKGAVNATGKGLVGAGAAGAAGYAGAPLLTRAITGVAGMVSSHPIGAAAVGVGAAAMYPAYHYATKGPKEEAKAAEEKTRRMQFARQFEGDANAIAALEMRGQTDLSAMAIERSNAMFSLGPQRLSDFTAQRQSAESAYAKAKGQADVAMKDTSYGAEGVQAEAIRAEQQALDRLISTRMAEKDAVLASTQAKIEGHKRVISDLEAESKARHQMIADMEAANRSVLERFGMADAQTQQKVLDIAKRMKAGQEVSSQDIAFSQSFLQGTEYEKTARKQLAEKGRRAGGGFLIENENNIIAEMKKGLKGEISATIRDERKIVAQLEWDEAAYQRSVKAAIKPLMAEQEKRARQLAKMAVDQAVMERNSEPAGAQ